MNIAALQAIGGMALQTTNASQSAPTAGNTFGSVFSGMTSTVALGTAAPVISDNAPTIDESILAIFGAATIEELSEVLKNTFGENVDMNNLKGLGEIAEKMGLEPSKLIESLLPLLKKAGVNEEDLSAIVETNDIWFVMETIEKVAPQFFKGLTDSLAGNGEIPKQQAVDLLTMLKTIQLVAPKTDLTMKQEQQVFSLQGFMAVASESFEQSLQAVKPKMVHLMETVHAGKQIVQVTNAVNQQMTGGQTAEEGTDKNSSSANKTEVVQHIVSSMTTTNTPQRAEITLTELENRNNARNEALIRDMQAIFKRSNFGQAGGTNRLLVKLYPEHLGQVRIELVQTNGIMTARILASTALGKEMLDSQLNQLRNAFVQQNVQVDRIDIAQTLQDTSRNDREQAFNEQFKQQQENNEKNEQQDDQELTFQEYMIELEA